MAAPHSYSHLAQVDHLVDGTATSYGKTLENQLTGLGIAVLNHLHIRVPRQPSRVALLFDPRITARGRSFVAATLLRLLATNQEPFEANEFRVRAFEVFDAELTEAYAALGVESGMQTFEKQRILVDLAPAAEEELRRVLGTPKQLRDQSATRQALMQLMNGRRFGVLISAFLPAELVDGPFATVVASVTDVLESDGVALVDAYDESSAEIEALEAASNEVGTRYAEILADYASALRLALENHFRASDVSRPAKLYIGAVNKKYSIIEGAQIEVWIRLVNDGPGTAFDVVLEVEAADGLEIPNAVHSLGNWPCQEIVMPIVAAVREAVEAPAIQLKASWKNGDGSLDGASEILVLPRQDPSVQWDLLRARDPYDLEPVTTQEALVGRDEILAELVQLFSGERLGSAILYGQKRVGKTSIARTLQTQLKSQSPDTLVAYLEVAPYGRATVEETVTAVCQAVARKSFRRIRSSQSR